MTVLLIDDDEDDQDIFREALRTVRPDIHCMEARDGQEGLSVLQELTLLPDFIFLDINMPKMDGKEFLKHVKADPSFKNIPVVVYTTSKHKSEVGEYFRLGATNFITKPSEFNLLLSHIRSVIS